MSITTQERAFGVPLVIEQEMGGERTYDIYSRLLKDRIICVFGQVHDQLAAAVVAQLLFLASDKPDQPIKMYINSPGGVVTAGMAIYDCMQLISCPVETWCLGNAASMGSLLLTAGSPGCRYALPNAQIMIHQPLGGAQGQATDILIAAKNIDRMKKTLTQTYVTHNAKDKTYEEFFNAMERDNFMTAQEALDFGIIDKIPEMTVPKPRPEILEEE